MGKPLAAGREILEPEEIEMMIRRAKQPSHKAFLALIYLLGARVGELTGFWRKRCPLCKKVLGRRNKSKTFEGMKHWGCPTPECNNFEKVVFKKERVIGLRGKDIVIEGDVLVVRVLTAKQRQRIVASRRRIELPINHKLMSYILPYIRTIQDEAPVFRFSRRYAQKLISRTNPDMGGWSHLFRHTRATRLAEAGFRAPDIATYLGHVDLRSTSKYLAGSPMRPKEEGLR